MPDPLNHNYHLKAEVLTPLHIGGGKENNWQKDLDFFYYREKLRLINREKLFSRLNEQELNSLSSLMAGGKLNEFRNYLLKDKKRLESVTIRAFDLAQAPEQNEVVAMIRDGQGKVYMPGSSLKGALRSILFKDLKEDRSRNPSDVFGNINQDWMRLLRVTDAIFADTEIIHTKTFNLQGTPNNPRAGWKHAFRHTDERFKTKGFVTTFEVIPKGSTSMLRISLADGIYRILSDQQLAHARTADFIKKGQLAPFFQIINEHTRAFLEKEIKFYEKFSGDRTASIADNLKQLLANIPQDNNACILRLGLGSGFHSITGDWQHNDFTRTGVWQSGPQNRQGNFKVKSRKLAMEEENGQLNIEPMGFVKLTHITEAMLQQQAQAREEAAQKEKSERIRQEKEKTAAEAARQKELDKKLASLPKPLESELKTGDIIEAEIYKIERAFNMARYCPEPGKYSNQTVLMVGKKAKKDIPDFEQKFTVGALIRTRAEIAKSGKITLHFIDFVVR
jgi:CRISPR-associated protein Csm5